MFITMATLNSQLTLVQGIHRDQISLRNVDQFGLVVRNMYKNLNTQAYRQSSNTEPYEGNTQRYTTYSICVTKCMGDLAVEPLDLCIFV